MIRLQRVFLATGLGIVGLYVLSPYGPFSTLLYLTVSVSVPIAIVVGTRRLRPARTAPWYLLAVAFALYVSGDLVYTVLSRTPSGFAPFPNIGDAAYLAFYPLVFIALLGFVRAGADRNNAAWLDAMIWTVGAAILAWEPLLEPYFGSDVGSLGNLTALAYPVMDIVVLLMLVRMFVGRTARTPSYWLLMVGFAIQTIADVSYGLQVFGNSAAAPKLLDAGWLLSYVAVGGAALHPSMVAMTKPHEGIVALASRRRIVGLLIPISLAPGLLLYELAIGDLQTQVADVLVVGAASTAMVLLVLARGAGLLVIAERRSSQLVDRQSQLEVAMSALQAALTAGERSNAELNDRVTKDALTGLANRAHFVCAVELALAAGREPSIAFLDLDDFKSVNDTLGHEAGDVLLIELARRLSSAVGPDDLVARFGGDEFAVLFEGDAEQAVERLLARLEPPVELHGRDLRLEVSIGVATAGRGEESSGDLLRRADIAMYTAKRAGGGWASYQTGMSAVLRDRMDLRARLVAGLRNGEVTPWFQPIVDLSTRELRGFEALARWSPDGGSTMLPGDWLPMAEETALVVTVDRVVCRAAFAQLALWRSGHRSAHDLHLAVNLSARTLQHVGIAEELIAMLAEVDVPPNRIVVEVTEGVLLDDPAVSARLQVLRAAGVRVALDDFGTGWSSLSYLQKFPVDLLKLDRSFTAELGPQPGGHAIPAAVLQLARAMSLGVIAEGVETVDQLDSLLDLGFKQAQGYLFASALTAQQVETLLREPIPQHLPTAGALPADSSAVDAQVKAAAARAAALVVG